MGIVNKREKETQARIQTQKHLKDAAKMLKIMESEIDKTFSVKGKYKGSNTRLIKLVNDFGDKITKGRLISKNIFYRNQRVSKQRIFTWLFLEHDENNPFEHFEEKCFSVSNLIFFSKQIDEPIHKETGIYIIRHCLERVYERMENLHTLECILKILSPYISAMLFKQYDCDRMTENNSFILVSNTSYLVVKSQRKEGSFTLNDYMITTFLPIQLWSSQRKGILTPIVELINHLNNLQGHKFTKPIAIIRPSLIEMPLDREVTEDDIKLIHGYA